MQTINLATDEFLVRLSFEHFVAALDSGGTVTGTNLPSGAMHFSYAEADRVAGRLRKRGYPHVHVEDVLGRPITLQMVENARIAAANVVETKPLPKTLRDLQKMPVSETKKRYKTEPEFAKRYDQIQATVGR